MNVDFSRAHDCFFGPPSELIDIAKFIDEAAAITKPTAEDILNHSGWKLLLDDARAAVAAECSGSVAELKATVENTWDNPMFSAHLSLKHEDAIFGALGQADGSAIKGRKRKRPTVTDGSGDTPELRALQEQMDTIPLRCWRFGKESTLFMRTSKNSDFNVLQSIKKTGRGSLAQHTQQGSEMRGISDAVLTLTVYNRIPWVQSYLARSSQHSVLASQTLGDFIRSIPCDSSEMPKEKVDAEGDFIGYHHDTVLPAEEEGCLLVIEGIAYGNGRSGAEHTGRLQSYVTKLPENKRPSINKSVTPLSQTTFNTLTLRLNQPYWMLHWGNCEHFVVVDQIRIPHPSDAPSGYPLILHLTPTLSELCKACCKVPAVMSVVGDIRLGESPCLLCTPCWRIMGPPQEEGVTVVPLVKHRRIWADEEDSHINTDHN
ncbi:snRNA-activating protein of 50kDa MW C terminal-domain-containing protein [Scleroderma citrinum]